MDDSNPTSESSIDDDLSWLFVNEDPKSQHVEEPASSERINYADFIDGYDDNDDEDDEFIMVPLEPPEESGESAEQHRSTGFDEEKLRSILFGGIDEPEPEHEEPEHKEGSSGEKYIVSQNETVKSDRLSYSKISDKNGIAGSLHGKRIKLDQSLLRKLADIQLYIDKGFSNTEIMVEMGISNSSLWRYKNYMKNADCADAVRRFIEEKREVKSDSDEGKAGKMGEQKERKKSLAEIPRFLALSQRKQKRLIALENAMKQGIDDDQLEIILRVSHTALWRLKKLYKEMVCDGPPLVIITGSKELKGSSGIKRKRIRKRKIFVSALPFYGQPLHLSKIGEDQGLVELPLEGLYDTGDDEVEENEMPTTIIYEELTDEMIHELIKKYGEAEATDNTIVVASSLIHSKQLLEGVYEGMKNFDCKGAWRVMEARRGKNEVMALAVCPCARIKDVKHVDKKLTERVMKIKRLCGAGYTIGPMDLTKDEVLKIVEGMLGTYGESDAN